MANVPSEITLVVDEESPIFKATIKGFREHNKRLNRLVRWNLALTGGLIGHILSEHIF